MCEKCARIDKAIERFRGIRRSISEELTVAKAKEVIADSEALKSGLHPRQGWAQG